MHKFPQYPTDCQDFHLDRFSSHPSHPSLGEKESAVVPAWRLKAAATNPAADFFDRCWQRHFLS
jgi:hypothetical protein